MRLARTIVPLLAFVLIACGQSAAPETPSGPWREVGHGAWQDVQWRIFEAGHPSHGRCLAVDLVPPPIVEELPPEGRYRGKDFNCSLTADEVLRRPRLLPTTYDLSRQLRYRWLLATVPRKASSLRVRLDDGSAAYVGGDDGIALVLLPAG